MSGFPHPETTPEGPTYQGRLLSRPAEEIVDQGAAFDLGTLVSRRRLFGLVGLGAGTALLAACTPTAVLTGVNSNAPTSSPDSGSGPVTGELTPDALPSGEVPDETAGPYPGDGSNGPNALIQNGIVRSDIRASIGSDAVVTGVPLTLTLTITDMALGDAPFEGVAVYVWHCDAEGRYSMYSSGVEDETFLRGVQVADSNGQVRFTSIIPGCYTGRWPHIHFEVYPSLSDISSNGTAIATSQIAFPEGIARSVYALPTYPGSERNLSQISLASDNVFGEDLAALQMATITGDTSSGFSAVLLARVDTRTAPTGGSTPGGPGNGGPAGGPRGPGSGGPGSGGPGSASR